MSEALRAALHTAVDMLVAAIPSASPAPVPVPVPPTPKPPPVAPTPPPFAEKTVLGAALKPAFEDRFAKPDPDRWEHRLPWERGKNPMGQYGLGGRSIGAEQQVYLDPRLGDPDPFSYGPKGLTITGRALTPEESADHLARMQAAGNAKTTQGYWGKTFGSGMLSGYGKSVQTYGYFEFAMRSDYWDPKDVGNFSAGWLAKNKDFSSGAAQDTAKDELDLLETIGGDFKPRGYQTVHWGASKDAGEKGKEQFVTPDFDIAHYHLVGMLWAPERITMFMDGQPMSLPGATEPGMPNPGCHAPMYPIVNQAIGGQWPTDLNCSPNPAIYNSKTEFAWYRAWTLAV